MNTLKSTPPTETPLSKAQSEVERNPNSASARNNLGWSHYGARAFDLALTEFDRALQIENSHLDSHYGRGLSLRALNRTEDAKVAFRKVMDLANGIDDVVRGKMLHRLAHGQINEMESGDWDLLSEMWHRNS